MSSIFFQYFFDNYLILCYLIINKKLRSSRMSTKTKKNSTPASNQLKPEIKGKVQKTQLKKIDVSSLSRAELSSILTKISKEEKMVQYYKRKFCSNPYFSTIYTAEHLNSILNETMARVINKVDDYYKRDSIQKNNPTLSLDDTDSPVDLPELRKDLDLSSIGNITGYMKMAFKWNISKDYKKYISKKNIGNSQTISIDSPDDSSDEQHSSLNIFNLLKEHSIDLHDDRNEKKRIIGSILKGLRKYDKTFNKRLQSQRKNINTKKLSKMAYLFLYTINPKFNCGKYVDIGQEKLGWTPYIFINNRNDMIKILKDNFLPELQELLQITSQEKNADFEEKAVAEKSAHYNFQSCDYRQIFSEKYEKEKIIVSLICEIFYNNNGKTGLIQQSIFPVDCLDGNTQEAKNFLLRSYEKEILDMKNQAKEIKAHALKNLFMKKN